VRWLVLLAMGCQFSHGTFNGDAGGDGTPVVDGDGSNGSGSDGSSDGGNTITPHCNGKVWYASFSSDPTTYYDNSDGTNDFAIRTGTFQTDQLIGGEWRVPTAGLPPLDTKPAQNFTTRAFFDLRMRGLDSNGNRGAVLYLNFAHTASNYATLIVDVKLKSPNQQEVRIVNGLDGAVENTLATIGGFDGSPVPISLEVNSATLGVAYRVGMNVGTQNLAKTAGTTTAKWASLTGYSTGAAFDEFRMEVCP
jgi:hypothetical protein